MRPHGRAQISPSNPRALGICQRCGFMYNLAELDWQLDYEMGPRLFNLRLQVCPTCMDEPQESGRTIVLPPDPVPVSNPLPENYVSADNPLSQLGFNPSRLFLPSPTQNLGGNIGNMTLNGGLQASWDANKNKRAQFCSALSISSSISYVGKNWSAQPSGIALTLPSTFGPNTHNLATYSLYAPNDRGFLNSATGITGYMIQGSSNNSAWTSLSSGRTAGGAGEVINGTAAGGFYQYHRAVIEGDGFSAVAFAQVVFNVSDAAPNDI